MSGTTKAVLILLAIGFGVVLLIYAYPLVLGGLAVYVAWFLVKMQQKNKVITIIVISILALVWFGYFVSNKNKPEVAGVETKQEIEVERKEATPTPILSATSSSSPTPSSASTFQEAATTPQATIQTNYVVKKSSTGICHAPGTIYYEKTKDYVSYDSIDECIASGGRLPKQ